MLKSQIQLEIGITDHPKETFGSFGLSINKQQRVIYNEVRKIDFSNNYVILVVYFDFWIGEPNVDLVDEQDMALIEWKEWSKLKGMSKEEAMKKYIFRAQEIGNMHKLHPSELSSNPKMVEPSVIVNPSGLLNERR